MKYLKLFEKYSLGGDVEKEFNEISRYISPSNQLGKREISIVYDEFKEYGDVEKYPNFSFLKDDGYYYMRYNNLDTTIGTHKQFYFKFDNFNEMIKVIQNIITWKNKYKGYMKYTRMDLKNFMDEMSLNEDPYFISLLKSRERYFKSKYPYPKD